MRGPIPYVGGKTRLARRIIALLPEHQTYCEPFAGGAQILFRKAPSNVEVLNDLDFDIINFFRVCQWHYEELIRYLRYCLVSRKLHQLHLASNPDTLTDIQRAGRFYVLQKTSWAGLVVKRSFHVGVTQRSNLDPGGIPEIIEQVHRRLQRVQIECLPYEQILEKYDRPTTVFMIDPPYLLDVGLYRYNFSLKAFQQLAINLRKLSGYFVLTLNDRPEIRQLFGSFFIQSIQIAYSAQAKSGRRFSELLITNFDAAKQVPETTSVARGQ